jgi:O-antigen ligase
MREWAERYRSYNGNVFFILSALILITLPFSVLRNSNAMVLLSIAWSLDGHWKTKFQSLKNQPLVRLFAALYLLHVIGLLYSENLTQGLFELEKKAAYIVFPVVFATSPYLNQRVIMRLLGCFVITCFLAAVFCLGHAFYQFHQTGDSSYFFYHKLSSILHDLHAVYFSVYIAFSIFILLFMLKRFRENLKTPTKAAIILLVGFFMVFLVLLSSKIIIATFFLLLITIVFKIILEKKGVIIALLVLLLSVAATVVSVVAVPQVRDRFTDAFYDKYHQTNPLLLDDYLYYHFTAANVRLAIWKTCFVIVNREHAWIEGVGTGDAQDLLTATYIEKHVYPGDEVMGTVGFLTYNAHNQFFQFYLSLGLLGLLTFTILVVYLLKQSLQKPQRPLLFFLVTLLTAFCLTESALNVQKGIIFFTFFSALLMHASWTEKAIEK